MYPRDAMQDFETQAPSHDGDRPQMDQAEARYGFRPLALPALAAAARPCKSATKVEARGTRRGVLAIIHEDAPID